MTLNDTYVTLNLMKIGKILLEICDDLTLMLNLIVPICTVVPLLSGSTGGVGKATFRAEQHGQRHPNFSTEERGKV